MTPDDIQTLFQSGGPVEPPAGGDGGDGAEEVTAGRVAALKEVLAAAQQLWSRDSGSEELDLFAEKLGDGSRDGEFERGTTDDAFPRPGRSVGNRSG